MFEIITYDSLIKLISENKSAFICGNGFSINFDSKYSANSLSKSLFSIHNHLKSFQQYDVVSNTHFKNMKISNYKATKKVINRINTEEEFISLFSDAVKFAHSIISDHEIVKWLKENNFNLKLQFGLEQIHLVESLVKQAATNGVLNVNYEYWTVLIYYVLALTRASSELYLMDTSNVFIRAVLAGNSNPFYDSLKTGMDLLIDVTTNGMYIYLRFLFASNILLHGNSFNVEELEKWSYYNINTIKDFLSNFDYLMTTNYDMLLESITQKNIGHLHGSFSKEKKRVLYESLGVYFNCIRYDLSTVIIGDYFLSKSFFQITMKLASTNSVNSNIKIYADIIKETIQDGKSSVVVIFGLGIDNDYHILRDIQIQMEAGNVYNPHIIYCYYNDQDKESFIKSYQKCITYSKGLNEYVKNKISVSVIDSKEIIDEVFLKK